MSSASSVVTYTSVYTDSEPGIVFWGANEEISDRGSPRVIIYGYDGLPMQPLALPSPDYVPGPDLSTHHLLITMRHPWRTSLYPLMLYPADGGDGDDEPSDDDTNDDDADDDD
ncbi:hypothetical protein Tco_0372307, partial [Tanacetum coccineum]